MDSRTRRGFAAVQFEQLVEDETARHLVLDTPVARFRLTRHDNVVSCIVELLQPVGTGIEALQRRGAVDGTFMISHKLAPRDFGIWIDQVLTEDLGATADVSIEVLSVFVSHAPWVAV